MEAQTRECSVYYYGQREAQTSKNVTSQVNDSVAKWRSVKSGFDSCEYCLQCHIFYHYKSELCISFTSMHHQREKPVICFGCLKNCFVAYFSVRTWMRNVTRNGMIVCSMRKNSR